MDSPYLFLPLFPIRDAIFFRFFCHSDLVMSFTDANKDLNYYKNFHTSDDRCMFLIPGNAVRSASPWLT